MKFILGTKEKMTQIFSDEGISYPVTAIKVSPAVVSQVKTKEKDGYSAVQFAYGTRKAKNLSKPVLGHLKKIAEGSSFATIREVRLDKAKDTKKNMKSDWTIGDKIEPSVFVAGDKVEISAISKSKGFQGVVKRHGFKGGPRTHGQKHTERAPGSIGTAGFQRVFKNMRMAGRMGGERVTFKNMKIIRVEESLIFIEGAVPGRRGTVVEIKG